MAGDAATLGAMSRCCVVKVITLTEIQLLQVGGGGDSTTGQGNRDEIRSRKVKSVNLFVFACKMNCLCFMKGMHLQPEQLHNHCGMQTL